jgi:hypothetical protein
MIHDISQDILGVPKYNGTSVISIQVKKNHFFPSVYNNDIKRKEIIIYHNSDIIYTVFQHCFCTDY